MKQDKKIICYVDDEKEEIRRFRKNMETRYIVAAGVTLQDALAELGDRRPDLFLLDLYYGPKTTEKQRKAIKMADLRVSEAEADVRRLMNECGQTPVGGRKLAQQVGKRYKGVPRAFFSRKAFLEDALAAFELGLPLLEKPDPNPKNPSDDYDKAFRRCTDEVARRIDGIMLARRRAMPDPTRVFVIYGRNANAYNQMVKFVRALKLDPKSFYDVSAECGASPTVLKVVRHGMKQAAGVVAMFTPDESAFLRPTLNPKREQNEDTQRWQARPNVIFEAGLALGIAEERTVLVRLGRDVRLFSDVGGIHLVNLDNSHKSRNLLRGRLRAAGCQPDMETGDHLDPAQAGDFEACLQLGGQPALADPFAHPARRTRRTS